VVTAFNDGSILIWDSETFNIRWKVSLETFAADLSEGPVEASKSLLVPRALYFSISADGEYLAYSGRYVS
jgi:hypothetical protein